MGRVRGALAPLCRPREDAEYDTGLELARTRAGTGDPVAEFTSRLVAVNGEVAPDAARARGDASARGWTRGYCDRAMAGPQAHFGEGFTVETSFDRSRVERLTSSDNCARGRHRGDGHDHPHDARPRRASARSRPGPTSRSSPGGALCRHRAGGGRPGRRPERRLVHGPSKTADVEGILIEGVHGRAPDRPLR